VIDHTLVSLYGIGCIVIILKRPAKPEIIFQAVGGIRECKSGGRGQPGKRQPAVSPLDEHKRGP
jgi:hypothetical protein